jgi:peroxiredoxin Q/BCP
MIAGDRAPDFTLLDHLGQPQTLSALLDRGPVVLFFYPLASSPICTAQACHFRDLTSEFAMVGAQRLGISTDTVDRQAHFAQQRSFDYPLLSDTDGVVAEMFGVRRGRLARLRRTVVAPKDRHRHIRRRGLLSWLLPVRRTTFVIDSDRTILEVIANELRASIHADRALSSLRRHNSRQAERAESPPVDMFAEPSAADKPSLVRPYALTAGRTDSEVDLPLEAPIEAVNPEAKSTRWPKSDIRQQILAFCAHGPSVAEIAAGVSLPLGATRFLVGELVTQGYLRVQATPAHMMTLDERRELLSRTLRGLRAL